MFYQAFSSIRGKTIRISLRSYVRYKLKKDAPFGEFFLIFEMSVSYQLFARKQSKLITL